MKSHSDETISLFLAFEPDIPKLTHQNGLKIRAVRNRPLMFKSPALRELEARYISLLKPYAPEEPWNCPIHLATAWYFRAPAKTGKANLPAWKTTKPDTDNLVKTLKDCMKLAGFFVDDALVCFDSIAKFFVAPDSPHGIHIRLRKLDRKEIPQCN